MNTTPPITPTNVLEYEHERYQIFKRVLDEKLNEKDCQFVQVAKMAGTESYMATLTFQEVAVLLRFARDLGLFNTMFDPHTGEMKIDQDTIDEIQQRPLDFTRQLPLATYLAGRKHHKFPAILAVQTDDWVDNPDQDGPQWERGPDGQMRATSDSTRFTDLDSKRKVGLLELLGYIYALDGQHRLLGIKGLMELILNRRIVPKTKNGDPAKKDHAITIDMLVSDYGVNAQRLNSLQYETIGVEIIPAIKKGETRDEARRRVKSVFTHVNKTAVRLTPGQIAQLDEDDGFAIVAKRVAVHHSLLKSTGTRAANPRVNWQNSTISNTSTVLTTLQTLTEVAEGYLGATYKHWKSPVKDLIPVRPDDDELDDGVQELSEFLNGFATLPSIEDLDRGKTTKDYRLLKKEGGQAHLLFRPLGQIALARALGDLVHDKSKNINGLFRMLRDYEAAGGFEIDNPANPWWGVVYDPAGQKIARGGELGAERILRWLLGGITTPATTDELRDHLVDRRTIRDGGPDEGKVRDFDGNAIDPTAFKLPPMLT